MFNAWRGRLITSGKSISMLFKAGMYSWAESSLGGRLSHSPTFYSLLPGLALRLWVWPPLTVAGSHRALTTVEEPNSRMLKDSNARDLHGGTEKTDFLVSLCLVLPLISVTEFPHILNFSGLPPVFTLCDTATNFFVFLSTIENLLSIKYENTILHF